MSADAPRSLVASWDRHWRVVAPGGCHPTLHRTERGVGSGPAGPSPPCPAPGVPWAGSAAPRGRGGGGPCVPGAGGCCGSAGRRCGGCAGSGGSRGSVPRGPSQGPPRVSSNVVCLGGWRSAGLQPLHQWCWGLWFGATGAAGGCHRVTVSPHHLVAQLRDWGPCPAGAGSWLKALYGSAHQQPWGHGDITPGSALRRADVSCSLPQVLLICYKSCWDSAFQVTEELRTSLQLRLEGSEEEEEENGSSDSALEPGQPVAQWQGHGDASEAVLERLEGLEADVRFLCTELGAEKLLWSSRFLELLREQQSLRQRLQELPWQWNRSDSPELLGEVEDQSASGSEGESPEGRRWTEPLWQPRGTTQPK
ncbi:uncharacterized protein LOC127462394 [Manacus candei]|uniref:uncharacterized protein LOC127462394 n=1 Tax=Manacus candei TaxID=415023 RepID=UPI0022263CDB|nr:uncharacterized protein LOC127462394 [Manacus candei]